AAHDSWIINGEIGSLIAAHDHAQQLGMASVVLDIKVDLELHQVLVSEGSLAPAAVRLASYVEEARRLGNTRTMQYALSAHALAAALRADRPMLAETLARLEGPGAGLSFLA